MCICASVHLLDNTAFYSAVHAISHYVCMHPQVVAILGLRHRYRRSHASQNANCVVADFNLSSFQKPCRECCIHGPQPLASQSLMSPLSRCYPTCNPRAGQEDMNVLGFHPREHNWALVGLVPDLLLWPLPPESLRRFAYTSYAHYLSRTLILLHSGCWMNLVTAI